VTEQEWTALEPGQKVTVYTVDHRAHTGSVSGITKPGAFTLRVDLSQAECAEYTIQFAAILYWCEFFDEDGNPIMGAEPAGWRYAR